MYECNVRYKVLYGKAGPFSLWLSWSDQFIHFSVKLLFHAINVRSGLCMQPTKKSMNVNAAGGECLLYGTFLCVNFERWYKILDNTFVKTLMIHGTSLYEFFLLFWRIRCHSYHTIPWWTKKIICLDTIGLPIRRYQIHDPIDIQSILKQNP